MFGGEESVWSTNLDEDVHFIGQYPHHEFRFAKVSDDKVHGAWNEIWDSRFSLLSRHCSTVVQHLPAPARVSLVDASRTASTTHPKGKSGLRKIIRKVDPDSEVDEIVGEMCAMCRARLV
jgi:hypothetical protein